MRVTSAPRRRFVDPLTRRRWESFKANRRGYWALWVFLGIFALSLIAELIANDNPILLSQDGRWMSPVFTTVLDSDLAGDLPEDYFYQTAADFTDPFVQCLVQVGPVEACDIDPEGALETEERTGWILWPLVPWSYDTINKDAAFFPAPPSAENWWGTDDRGRDLVALTLYGVRLSVSFGLLVTAFATVVGVLAGAAQGYFGGWVDLFFQRIVEIWSTTPTLFVIMIISSVFVPNFWLLAGVVALFSWTALVGVVRAEFLRARNFEYVQAAKALGVGDWTIMTRHLLPNAMVATLTMLPFVLTGTITTLAILDFLGFGLAENHPSLGEIGLQAKNNLQAPWIGLTAFFSLAIMLSLLVFIFEAVRDAFDPRKTFN